MAWLPRTFTHHTQPPSQHPQPGDDTQQPNPGKEGLLSLCVRWLHIVLFVFARQQSERDYFELASVRKENAKCQACSEVAAAPRNISRYSSEFFIPRTQVRLVSGEDGSLAPCD